MVVWDVQNMYVIHDRHKGVLQAISDIKYGSQECYREVLWSGVLKVSGAHSTWEKTSTIS
jgi:hypothetical protein